MMKTLILLLNLLLAFCYVNDGVPANHESRSSAETASIASCPDPNAVNHSIMEDFLTKPAWDERREAVNVKNISVSQITLLTDSSDNNACTLFNDTFQEVLDEESSLGDKIYDVTYYKAGSFYFVVMSLSQPANETYIAVGVSYMAIYNHNLDLVEAYAF